MRGNSRGRLPGLRHLLASSSVAAILIGGGTPAAFAQCANYNNTTAPGCTNSTAITGIAINNSTVTSTITNNGTISPNGVALTNGSTIQGGIADNGTINGGISVDASSNIAGPNSIIITGPSFGGGISNGGTIAGAGGVSC
jgi:hypothetical protein